jgi:hypothetical protein
MPVDTFSIEKPFLRDLLKEVGTGNAQLPEFQRGWVWPDRNITSLLASVAGVLGRPRCHRASPFRQVLPESLAARLRNRAIARWAQKAWSSRWMGPLSWSWAVLGTIYPKPPMIMLSGSGAGVLRAPMETGPLVVPMPVTGRPRRLLQNE